MTVTVSHKVPNSVQVSCSKMLGSASRATVIARSTALNAKVGRAPAGAGLLPLSGGEQERDQRAHDQQVAC